LPQTPGYNPGSRNSDYTSQTWLDRGCGKPASRWGFLIQDIGARQIITTSRCGEECRYDTTNVQRRQIQKRRITLKFGEFFANRRKIAPLYRRECGVRAAFETRHHQARGRFLLPHHFTEGGSAGCGNLPNGRGKRNRLTTESPGRRKLLQGTSAFSACPR